MNKITGKVTEGSTQHVLERGIRSIAAEMLASGEVDVFIGYEEGTLPLRTTPAFITRPEDASRLVWGPTCENNLTVYLPKFQAPKFQGTVGIVVKGCDVRTLTNLILENQIHRDKVKIVGIPCSGIVHRDNVLAASCEACRYPVPVLYDVLVGDESMARDARDPEAAYLEVDTFAELQPDARLSYFADEIEGCIQCYACRQACPLCYCEECFADRQSPKWISRWRSLSDKILFHLGRVLHVAGRCVDCGACRRACPVGIDLRLLTKNMEKVVKESFGYESGLDVDGLPLLATYRREDPDDFIL